MGRGLGIVAGRVANRETRRPKGQCDILHDALVNEPRR